jgi:hypothetical protein
MTGFPKTEEQIEIGYGPVPLAVPVSLFLYVLL